MEAKKSIIVNTDSIKKYDYKDVRKLRKRKVDIYYVPTKKLEKNRETTIVGSTLFKKGKKDGL